MAKLTSKRRKRLKKKSFAIPGKRAYPIHDRSHARNALSRVSQHGTASQKKRVRAAVCSRYPDMCGKKSSSSSSRRRRKKR